MINRYDLRLDLDMHCNLRCEYCHNKDWAAEDKARIDLKILEPLFAEMNENCWSLYLSCSGEPTMHPQFSELLRVLKEKVPRPDLSMVTNGVLLNEANRKAIFDSSLNRLLVSLDTLDENLFAKLCGTTPQQAVRIRENLAAFASERSSYSNPPHLIVTAIVMKSTLAGLPALARWLKEIRASSFNIQWLNPLDIPAMKAEVVEPNSPEVVSTLRAIQKELAGSSVLLDWPRAKTVDKAISVWKNRVLFRNKGAYLWKALMQLLASKRGQPCIHAGNIFYIDPKGLFKVCPESAYPVSFPKSSSELAQLISQIRSRFSKQPPEACKTCAFAFGCKK